MTSSEQAKAQMVAFLKTKSAKYAVEENDVISWGILNTNLDYRAGEDLINELLREETIEGRVHDGSVWLRGMKEA